MFFIGIDVAKKSHRCCILNPDGEKACPSFSFESSLKGFSSLLDKILALSTNPKEFIIAMEATGNLWENLFEFLFSKGFSPILLNPFQTNRFRETIGKKIKTDDIDALTIAGLLRSGEAKSSYVTDETVQTIRELVRLRTAFLKDLQDYERQALSLLNVVFPEYLKLVKHPFGIASLLILHTFPTAKAFSQAKLKDLSSITRSIQGNNFNDAFLKNLIKAAKKSISSGKADSARSISIRMLTSQIQQLKDNISNLDQEIDSILNPNNLPPNPLVGNLNTIPGVGPKTIAAIIGEMGNISRFSSSASFVGSLGLFPAISSSGESTKAHPKMSKQGPSIARRALYLAAVASIKHNPALKNLYHRKISQGKAPKQALIVVARKLACIIYSMIKHNSVFDLQRVFLQTKPVLETKRHEICHLVCV